MRETLDILRARARARRRTWIARVPAIAWLPSGTLRARARAEGFPRGIDAFRRFRVIQRRSDRGGRPRGRAFGRPLRRAPSARPVLLPKRELRHLPHRHL